MTNKVLELKEQVFAYVEKNGPVLPATIAKEFRSTPIFVSALLSELVTNKRIKLTRAKVGGSPLYYATHQREKLYDRLRDALGQKQREALDLLREKSVVRDRDGLPFERVALRELEDFAVPVKLVINNVEEVFWKWYLLPDQDAKALIEQSLETIYAPKKEDLRVQQDSPLEAAPKKKRKKFLQDVLIEKPKKKESGNFAGLVSAYMEKMGIRVTDKTLVTKEKEYNLLVQVPTPIDFTPTAEPAGPAVL